MYQPIISKQVKDIIEFKNETNEKIKKIKIPNPISISITWKSWKEWIRLVDPHFSSTTLKHLDICELIQSRVEEPERTSSNREDNIEEAVVGLEAEHEQTSFWEEIVLREQVAEDYPVDEPLKDPEIAAAEMEETKNLLK